MSLLLWTAACDDPSILGTSGQGKSALNIAFTDTFTVEAYTIWPDTTYSTNTSRALVGRLVVPGMVAVKARAFSQINANVKNNLINKPMGSNPTFLKAEVNLYYDYVNGDSLEKGDLIISELDSPIYQNNYSIFRFLPKGRELGRLSGHRPGYVNPQNIATYRTATVVLDSAYARGMFERIKAGVSLADFRNTYKGMVFEATYNQAVIGFLIETAITNIKFTYYQTPSDTVAQVYFLGFNGGWHFNQLTPDFSPNPSLSDFKIGDSIPAAMTSQQVFLQSGLGWAAMVRFPYFHKWLSEQKVYINKAELVLDPVFDYNPELVRPPSNLFFYAGGSTRFVSRDTATKRYLGISFESTPNLLNSVYNATGRSYSEAPITLYLQNLLFTRKSHQGLIIYPDQATAELSILPSVKIGGPQQADPNLRLKLRVYFTTNQ